MAETKTVKQPKLFDKIDAKVEGREGLKTVWQAGKFSLFSVVAMLIQTTLQLILPFIFDRMTTPLPGWLSWIINPGTLSPEQQALYVVAGVVTWGYLLPFFLSNYTANIVTYILNKKYTFKSSAPHWHFVLYFILMTLVIVFSTWLQGVCFGWLGHYSIPEWLNRLLVMAPAGLLQFIAFFVIQKILLPEDPELAGKKTVE